VAAAGLIALKFGFHERSLNLVGIGHFIPDLSAFCCCQLP